MIDSCSPSKLEPGFAATYSKPSILITSTMKADAGCSMMRADAREGGGRVSADNCALTGVAGTARLGGSCVSADTTGAALATRPTAPSAAPFKNRRRPADGRVSLAMGRPLRRRLRLMAKYTRVCQKSKTRCYLLCPTVSISTADTLAFSLTSPPYFAVIECDPVERLDVVNVAVPPLSGAVPSRTEPSKNCTAPVAVEGEIAALNVTGCPPLDGLRLDVSVVAVLALFTVCETAAEELAPCVLSP